jgi:predicted ferric reductase
MTLPGFFLLVLYLAITLAPIALAWASGMPPRPFMDDLSSGLAMTAFAALTVEFILSGRFRKISDRIGIDITMRFHQLFARTLLVLVLLHPFLYTLPIPIHPLPWDPTASSYLRLDGTALMTGGAAWVLLGALIVTGIARDSLPYRYETWRFGHGLGALMVMGLSAHHALEAGRYSATQPIALLWFALIGIATLSLVYVYVVSPVLMLRSPFKLTSFRQIAERTWELVIERCDGGPFRFKAGQFVWLSLHPTPFTLEENPFSIASAPHDDRHIAFVIKEIGDFTRSLGALKIGQRAWVDGPHGALTLPGPEAAGIGLIAGGVGIVPLLSILRQMHATGDDRPVTLLYGNRLESQIVYRAEFERLAAEPNISVTHVLREPPDGWTGETGVINASTIETAFGDRQTVPDWTYLLCGPPAMINGAETVLRKRGVPANQIISERFVYDGGEDLLGLRRRFHGRAIWWSVSAILAASALAFALR